MGHDIARPLFRRLLLTLAAVLAPVGLTSAASPLTPDSGALIDVLAHERSTTMHRITHLVLSLALVAAVATGMIAVPHHAAAASLVPFHATMNETFLFQAPTCDPNMICSPITGSGQATHLGRTSEAAEVFVDLLNPPAPNCLSETRTVTLTGANGDQITLALTGQSCVTAGQPGTLTVGTAADSWVVTGGTGRFSGATGSGTNTALIDGATLTAVTTFTGTLSTPGSQ
jgi:hypothetical protein